MPPVLSSSHPPDRIRNADDGSTKSLTPQRKHRKLMKDGSGIEVWPESVEKIFVEGLRKYWESPYATYSQSRGRSRWRNQFLVDYLKKSGVERSKKQVASHIQVLRNMWKGEPEFHLVAGGEELYPEGTQSTNVKVEEQWDPLVLRYPDYDDAESSSNSTSPNFSPSEIKTEFPPSPSQPLRAFPPDSHTTKPFYSNLPDRMTNNVPCTSAAVLSLTPSDSHHPTTYAGSINASNLTTCMASNYDFSASPNNFAPIEQFTVSGMPMQTAPVMGLSVNRVKALKLTADGMNPFWVKLDTLTSAGQLAPNTPLVLKIKLGISFVTNLDTPSTVQGFAASIYLANIWSYSGRCLTNVYINGACGAPEDAPLTVASVVDGSVVAALPESQLNRCRWLDPSLPTIITQEIVVDNQTLLFIVYILDRRAGAALPWAQLSSFQRYNHVDKTSAAHFSPVFQSAQDTTNTHSLPNAYTLPSNQYACHDAQQFSLAHMPTLVYHNRNPMSTCMTC
ncbi:hypothetical protein AX17_003524 [Amanita inopinata Kibby_2008]|nr:hypothetical protein AX17_003524 [Amanita inopinata Kibby_2008]